jgi:transcriptional regulator of NAD metabolism
MNGEERRGRILEIIRQAAGTGKPVPGAMLARELNVSRQVVVQDIALLRAAGADIVSTNRGYILVQGGYCQRVFKVNHTDAQIEEELTSIVDLGGTVVDVFVWHKVYGKVQGELAIDSRRRVEQFMEGLRTGRSSPLKNITSGYHYHTVRAADETTLDLVEQMLAEKGYLVSEP